MRILPINKTFSDSELLEKFRVKGDTSYLGVLYNRYFHLVYGVCLKYLKDNELAKDAVMDIYEKIGEPLKIQEVTYFKSWLYVLSKNHCLMEIRKKKHTTIPFDGNFIMENISDAHPIGEKLELEEDLISLEECMKALKVDQEACIRLFYLEKKSYKEINEGSLFSLNEVKSLIQNGKRNLKICMEQKHG